MKYVPPLDAVGEDDPYLDANIQTSFEGSAVPAAAIEHPMREIMEVIEFAGLAPDEEDLTQLLQAILLLIQLEVPALPIASTEQMGITEHATNPEAIAMTAGDKALVPSNLPHVLPGPADEDTPGLSERATLQEAKDMLDGERHVVPAHLKVVGLGAWKLLESQVITEDTATVDFTGFKDNDRFHSYVLDYHGVKPAQEDVDAMVRLSTDDGASWISAVAYNTIGLYIDLGIGPIAFQRQGQSGFRLSRTAALASNDDKLLGGRVIFNNFAEALAWPQISFQTAYALRASHSLAMTEGRGQYAGALTPDAIRFLFSNGDIARGKFNLYGISYK